MYLDAVISYVNRPIPYTDGRSHKVWTALWAGLFLVFFLLVFQPFGIADITKNKFLVVFGFGAISSLVIYSTFNMATWFTKESAKRDWTVKKLLVTIFVQLCFISILNWVFNTSLGSPVMAQHSLVFFFFTTFSIGVFPALMYVVFMEYKWSYQTYREVNIDETLKNGKLVTLGMGASGLTVSTEDILCISSQGNYILVYYIQEGKVVRTLVRFTLLKAWEQLECDDRVCQCHRSFLVNFRHVASVKGNAKGRTLYIPQLDFGIPVSRSFPAAMLKKMIGKP